MQAVTLDREISLSLRIYPEAGRYVAHSPQLDIASEGDRIEDARASFIEAVSLWLETATQEELSSRIGQPEWDELLV